MKSLATFSVVFLALSFTASAKFSVPIKKIQGTGAYLKGGAPHAGRARAEFLKSSTSSVSPTSVRATDIGIGYTTSIGVGDPPTYYDLVIDTGRANTWIGGNKSYVPTHSGRRTDQEVTIGYIQQVGGASTDMKGVEYVDTVTLAPYLAITNQSIGVASDSPNVPHADGTIGFGPMGLSNGTLSPDKNVMVSTVMNTLVSEGIIEEEILGIFFAPAEYAGEQNGFLTYGGIESSLCEGNMTYAPLTTMSPASKYWGFDVESCTYGDRIIASTPTTGIVDSASVLLYLASDFFELYIQGIPGAQLDPETGLIEIPDSSIRLMQPLSFNISGETFNLDVAAQLIPKGQYTTWGGVKGKNYGVIGTFGANSSHGLGLAFGQPFMQRFYTVLDARNSRVGFAKTTYS